MPFFESDWIPNVTRVHHVFLAFASQLDRINNKQRDLTEL